MSKIFKLLSIVILMATVFAFPNKSEGQALKRPVVSGSVVIKDSVVNSETKYVNFFSSPNGITGASLTGVKSSGTPSAYAILQYRTDTMPRASTSVWNDYIYPGTTKRDTLFFTNVAEPLGYTWPVPVQFFNGVRFKIVSTGTQKIYLYGSLLQR